MWKSCTDSILEKADQLLSHYISIAKEALSKTSSKFSKFLWQNMTRENYETHLSMAELSYSTDI